MSRRNRRWCFIQSVKSAVSDEELRRKWDTVPQFVNQLLDRGVNAHIANQVITTIADTIAQKVIDDVIAAIGAPPAKFVYMVLGSEGRKEQTFKTDQDNAIIYEDISQRAPRRGARLFPRFCQPGVRPFK